MAIEMHDRMKTLMPIFFGIIMFIALIEGSITSFLTSRYNDGNHAPWPNQSFRDRVKFMVFTSWWTFILNGVYIALYFVAANSWISSVLSTVAYTGLTWLFWLCGVSSYTAALGGGKRCGHTTLSYCSHHIAAEAFGWIQWILLSSLLIFLIAFSINVSRRGDRLSAGIAEV